MDRSTTIGGPLAGGLSIPEGPSRDPAAPNPDFGAFWICTFGLLLMAAFLAAVYYVNTMPCRVIEIDVLHSPVEDGVRSCPAPAAISMLKFEIAGDLKTGFMEKRIGENSSRQSLPESWKWQKRYFVLSEPKGMLYYFKSADDPPNYKARPLILSFDPICSV